MLERISIQNYAVIENIAIDFSDGFSAFTGETGAGKSVLIGALGLLLGSRSDFSMIRSGEEKLTIEGEFTIANPSVRSMLQELGIEDSQSLIIRREIFVTGKTRAFVNGIQETLARLEEIGNCLVDMHGQHDHQLLLNRKVHIDILDSFGGLFPDRESFKDLYAHTFSILEEKTQLQENAELLRKEKEFYANAYHEIISADLESNEEEELEEKLAQMQNGEKIFDSLQNAYNVIYASELNAMLMLEDSRKYLLGVSSFSKKYEEIANIVEDSLEKARESSHLISKYLDEIEYSPEDMDNVTERLSFIRSLKRKYHKDTIEELKLFADESMVLVNKADNLDEELEKLEKESKASIESLKNKALRLSQLRQDAAQKMSVSIERELSFLGMEKAKFEVGINYVKDENSFLVINDNFLQVTPLGIDRVEFLISANPGEIPKPLQKIASGGEISRIMLSLKSALAQSDPVGTGVFDEIDAGIGGMIAHNVALKMKEIAKLRQIFCITHLAQIAAQADYHYSVQKFNENGKTFTKVVKLTAEERVKEIARMLGGQGENSEVLAREMLSHS